MKYRANVIAVLSHEGHVATSGITLKSIGQCNSKVLQISGQSKTDIVLRAVVKWSYKPSGISLFPRMMDSKQLGNWACLACSDAETRRRVAIMREKLYHNELFGALARAVWV